MVLVTMIIKEADRAEPLYVPGLSWVLLKEHLITRFQLSYKICPSISKLEMRKTKLREVTRCPK